MGEAQAETARRLIDSVAYMTLATADRDGRPWASPVWYAHDNYREFIWVSKPDARHSVNLAVRPELAIVIFDSHVQPGHGEGVYIEARATELTGSDADSALAIFSQRSVAQGMRPWSADDVGEGARLRLYGATASALFILSPDDRRIPVALHS